jgi:hypothetical protein
VARQLELDLPVPNRSASTSEVTAFAYMLALAERVPGHWIRNGLIAELEGRLDLVGDERWCRVIRQTAKKHVSKLIPYKNTKKV